MGKQPYDYVALERAAIERHEKAMGLLLEWRTKKRLKKLSDSNPPKSIQSKLESAKKQLALFDVSFDSPKPKLKNDDVTLTDNGGGVPLEHILSDPLAWRPWPENMKERSGYNFGSSRANSELIKERVEDGIGPGERWLAYLLGGTLQEKGRSFDIAFQSSLGVVSRWEVKNVDNKSSLILVCAEGRRMMTPLMKKFGVIYYQLENFIKGFQKRYLEEIPLDDETLLIVKRIEQFIETQTDVLAYKIFKKNITLTMSVLKFCKVLRDKYLYKDELGRRVSNYCCPMHYAVSELSDEVFVDREIFERLWNGLDIFSAFHLVDGVFIVNEGKGFIYVPKEKINDCFELQTVSMGAPNLRFVLFDDCPMVKLPRCYL